MRRRLPAINGRTRPTTSLNCGEDYRFLKVANPRIRNTTPTPTTALLPPKTAGPTSIGRAATTYSVPFAFFDFMTLLNFPIIVFFFDGRFAAGNRSAALDRKPPLQAGTHPGSLLRSHPARSRRQTKNPGAGPGSANESLEVERQWKIMAPWFRSRK
jgi:hypothetical protein